jgi:hypothetical protein
LKAFLAGGVSPSLETAQGETPLQIAKGKKTNNDTIRILEAALAKASHDEL